jgi:hypothetical protein
MVLSKHALADIKQVLLKGYFNLCDLAITATTRMKLNQTTLNLVLSSSESILANALA